MKEVISLTYREIFQRISLQWNSDELFSEFRINLYYFDEGGNGDVTKTLELEFSKKLGLTENEFHIRSYTVGDAYITDYPDIKPTMKESDLLELVKNTYESQKSFFEDYYCKAPQEAQDAWFALRDYLQSIKVIY